MAILATRQLLSLSPTRGASITLPKIAVDPLTSTLVLRLRRPTTANQLAWGPSAIIRTRLVLERDGEVYEAVGQASGGGRSFNGAEQAEYRLIYSPPLLWRGQYTRLGETAKRTLTAYAVLDLLEGSADLDLLALESLILAKPLGVVHNSVAFDAVTTVEEAGGDGVVSLSHTATITNAGVFASILWRDNGTTGSTSCTYGATGMTEAWDERQSTGNLSNAGYHWPGGSTVPSGAQTVTSTVADNALQAHHLGVISMTGVDQTTPVGTAVTATSSVADTTATVTVGSVGSDDMVVEGTHRSFGNAPTVGADQTERWNIESTGASGTRMMGSTQPGTAGGVMSWTWTGDEDWVIGAIAFKADGGGGATNWGPLLGLKNNRLVVA